MPTRPRLLVTDALLAMVAPATEAHFKMLEPASWLVESDRADLEIAADPAKPLDKSWPESK